MEVGQVAKTAKSAKHRKSASVLSKNYRPLVEMQVLNLAGDLVSRRSMNEDIMAPFASAPAPDAKLMSYFLKYLDDSAKQSLRPTPRTLPKPVENHETPSSGSR